MARNLYFDDPYKAEFASTVVKVDGNKVELEETWFFPQGGGQTGDSGTLNGERVADTVLESGHILHVMESVPALKPGDTVRGCIDWERRYRKMRLHSASHIVYYIMKEVFGGECGMASSGLLDESKERSDYTFSMPLDRAKLQVVEDRANALIGQDKEIHVYRDPTDPEVLVWRLEELTMHCCGTHPRNTKEIGRIRLARGKKPGKGRERIEISLVQ